MEYVTSFDYDKYSIDKTIIEEWLNKLYENSVLELERRDKDYLELVSKSDRGYIFDKVYSDRYNKIKEEDIKKLPLIVQGMDKYLFFLVSSGYVNSNNFSKTFYLISSRIDRVVPAIETDLVLSSFNDSIIGLDNNDDFSFKSKVPFYIIGKTLKIHQECFGENTIFSCIRDELDAVLVEENYKESVDYYEQIKKGLVGYKIDSDNFDKNIQEAFDFIYYCISYELLWDSERYNGISVDINDRYKSVLINQGDATKYSFQDEIREVMSIFIGIDSDIKSQKTSERINSFTKKCLEGDYLKKRCQDMSDEERDDLFMSLYHLGSLNFIVFPSGIRENSELAITILIT